MRNFIKTIALSFLALLAQNTYSQNLVTPIYGSDGRLVAVPWYENRPDGDIALSKLIDIEKKF